MGFDFFEPLPNFCVPFIKITPLLCLFGTVNINTSVLPDENNSLPPVISTTPRKWF